MHPEDVAGYRAAVASLVGGQPVVRFDHRLVGASSASRWVASSMSLEEVSPGCFVLRGVSVDREILQAPVENRKRSDFLAIMSHEIRTPLNAVLGLAGLLRDGNLDPDEQEYAELIVSSAEALFGMLDDLLDHELIVGGKLKMIPRCFCAADILVGPVQALASQARTKGLDVSISWDDRIPPMLTGDLKRVRQVLVNLMSNAVKYTPAGSIALRVEWGGSTQGEHLIRFVVADTGLGIPTAHQGQVFDAYERGRFGQEGTIEGTGLGLHIAAQLAEMMGGGIRLDSEDGVGSTFEVELTLPVAHAAPNQHHTSVAPLRVLLFDSAALDRTVCRLLLEAEGYDVTTAASSDDSLSLEQDGTFDVVLVGVGGAHHGGWDLARRLNAQPSARRPAVIALTDPAEQNARCRFAETGLPGMIAKPISRWKLLQEFVRLGLRPAHAPDGARPDLG